MSFLSGSGPIDRSSDTITGLAPNRFIVWDDLLSDVDSLKSFSFTDVHAALVLPFWYPEKGKNAPTTLLPGLTLVSISSHRDVYPVVSLGRRGIKGFTEGHGTIAGSLGFNSPGRSPFAGAIIAYNKWQDNLARVTFTNPDELPPMDLNLLFFNDEGDVGNILIRSLKIVDSAKNISVQDIQMTEVYSFIAASVTNMVDITNSRFTQHISAPVDISKDTKMGTPFHTRTLTPPTSGSTLKSDVLNQDNR